MDDDKNFIEIQFGEQKEERPFPAIAKSAHFTPWWSSPWYQEEESSRKFYQGIDDDSYRDHSGMLRINLKRRS